MCEHGAPVMGCHVVGCVNEIPPQNDVRAPWTPDQVDSLNAYQRSNVFHPYTGSRGPNGEERPILIATPNGWIEREGGPIYQETAMRFMAEWRWVPPPEDYRWMFLKLPPECQRSGCDKSRLEKHVFCEDHERAR